MCVLRVSKDPIRLSRSSPRPGFLDLDLMTAPRINLFKSATDTIILFCCMTVSRVATPPLGHIWFLSGCSGSAALCFFFVH
jgi:hypothetical protein